jgi:APA family basic amino acid/polyamine antiporter
LLDYVIFASWLLYGMTTATVLVLRRKRPDLARPYRTIGYPVVPVLFVVMSIAIVISALYNSPRESLLGLILIFTGLPFYFHWRKQHMRA